MQVDLAFQHQYMSADRDSSEGIGGNGGRGIVDRRVGLGAAEATGAGAGATFVLSVTTPMEAAAENWLTVLVGEA